MTYRCAEGYKLLGQAEIHCTANGTWDHPAPKCQCKSPLSFHEMNCRVRNLKFATYLKFAKCGNTNRIIIEVRFVEYIVNQGFLD